LNNLKPRLCKTLQIGLIENKGLSKEFGNSLSCQQGKHAFGESHSGHRNPQATVTEKIESPTENTEAGAQRTQKTDRLTADNQKRRQRFNRENTEQLLGIQKLSPSLIEHWIKVNWAEE